MIRLNWSIENKLNWFLLLEKIFKEKEQEIQLNNYSIILKIGHHLIKHGFALGD